MALRGDVGSALRKAIELTDAFYQCPPEVNQVWTLQECNRGITYYHPDFMELIADNPHNRTCSLRNMGLVR